MRRVVIITVVANLSYLPLVIMFDGIKSLDLKVVSSGTWFHLWFLSSLTFGMLTLLIPPKLGLRHLFISIGSIVFIILAHVVDIVSSFDGSYLPLARLCRFFMAGPLMWIGFRIASWSERPKPAVSLCLVFGGIMACIGETLVYSKIGLSIFNRQYPIGSLPIAIGVITWACETQRRPTRTLARIGRDYSLVIYIIHPLFLKIAALAFGRLSAPEWIPYWQVMFGIIFSLLFAYSIERYFPVVANLLQGELPTIKPGSTI